MMEKLLTQIRDCRVCEATLPLGANPVIQASESAKLLIIGQAPGARVHQTSRPWNDPSGDRLRSWLQIERSLFYDPKQVAIMPMGLCYPGKGKSGDLPPRKECAPLWHEKVLHLMPNLRLTLLIGQYAQAYYLKERSRTLTETVKNWRSFGPNFIPLPHPSPRNTLWLQKNSWFEEQVLPELTQRVHQLLQVSDSETKGQPPSA